MHRTAGNPQALRTYLLLNAAALIAAGIVLLLLSRSGHSNLRLILVAATFLLAAGAAAAAILLHSRPATSEALRAAVLGPGLTPRFTTALSLLFLILWWLTWFPPQYTGSAYYYFIGLYPLILWALFASGLTLVFITAECDGFSWSFGRRYLRQNRAALSAALIALAIFALIAFLTVKLKVLVGYEPFWYGAGVPILASQVLLALVIAVAALQLGPRLPRIDMPVDLLLFILIWVVAAALWASQPVPASFWVTAPRPPNQEYYPFSDLITFDLGSQFALIGQGIFNRVFFDRGLYMSFLVYLHAAGGQDYQRLMSIQAALFAVFPALLYLIGKRLHSRNAGLILAALVTLRGINSLSASAWIDTATFKHMLTDFPTAIGLAVFLLLVLRWLDSPPGAPAEAKASSAVWAAGVLGLTSLLRPHVVLLLPAIGLLAIWLYRAKWTRALMISGLMLLGFLAGIAPWLIFGPSSGSIFLLYGERVRAVIATRYPRLLPPELVNPVQPSAAPPQLPFVTPTPPASGPGYSFAVSQYLHNLVTSALIFPDSPEFLSVRETVKSSEGFWLPRWDGRMSPMAAGLLIFNLAVVAIGLGVAYHRLAWRGLLPMAILLIYHVVSALARTSGGRYLVPTDWIVVCYFALGLAELLVIAAGFLRRDVASPSAQLADVHEDARLRLTWQHTLAIVAQLAVIGALVPLAGALYPPRYPPADAAVLLQRIEPNLAGLGWSRSEVGAFLEQPGAALLYGRALYPRFYPQAVGEPSAYAPYTARNYPRTVFVLIGPHGFVNALLPGAAPDIFPNAADAFVLGCRYRQAGADMLSALAVVLPGQAVSIARSPAAPLSCPVPEPVCDNNKNCY